MPDKFNIWFICSVCGFDEPVGLQFMTCAVAKFPMTEN